MIKERRQIKGVLLLTNIVVLMLFLNGPYNTSGAQTIDILLKGGHVIDPKNSIDGKMDVAIWQANNGVWYILPSNSPGTYISRLWGMANDIPVPGDYDADGKMDMAIWRPSNGVWYVLPSGSPGTYTSTQWGASGDVPVSAVTTILNSLP